MYAKVYQIFAQQIIQIIFLLHASVESKTHFTKLQFHDRNVQFLNLYNYNLAFQKIFIN